MELYCKTCRKNTIQLTTGLIVFTNAVEMEYYKCMICGTTNFTSKHTIINLLKHLNQNHFNK